MPRFSVNLTMLFAERPFLERFEAAARSGFTAVEYMFPYAEDIGAIEHTLQEFRLSQVLFNLPAGNWQAGDRGVAVDPNRREEFRRGVVQAVEVARTLRCPRLNCLVGKRLEGVSEADQWQCLVDNLRYASRELARAQLTLLIEPVNTYDIPGFFLQTSTQAVRILEEVAAPNLRVQYDVYHMQRMEGNLSPTLTRLLDRIGHIQIADAPDRHEPGTGEIYFPYLLRHLDRLGYDGFVGLEYKPSGSSEASFKWIEAMGFQKR